MVVSDALARDLPTVEVGRGDNKTSGIWRQGIGSMLAALPNWIFFALVSAMQAWPNGGSQVVLRKSLLAFVVVFQLLLGHFVAVWLGAASSKCDLCR